VSAQRPPCPGSRPASALKVNLAAYHQLQPDGQRLIRGWFRRASHMADDPRGDTFEAFIFAWIAYNGWAACCSDEDSDAVQNDAMASSTALCEDFRYLLADDALFAHLVSRFYELWPIFSASELRHNRIEGRGSTRRELVEQYLAAGIRSRPGCYEAHRTPAESIPMDWPHTPSAIYQVRCNLFHGERAAPSESDRSIVDAALRTIVPFISRYILES
jgi:hypothetical protein